MMMYPLRTSPRPRRLVARAAATISLAAAALVAAACSNRNDRADGADTIAVPAAAVDTTQRTQTDTTTGAAVTTGVPGAGTAQSGREAATGVDTPITRRIKAGETP